MGDPYRGPGGGGEAGPTTARILGYKPGAGGRAGDPGHVGETRGSGPAPGPAPSEERPRVPGHPRMGRASFPFLLHPPLFRPPHCRPFHPRPLPVSGCPHTLGGRARRRSPSPGREAVADQGVAGAGTHATGRLSAAVHLETCPLARPVGSVHALRGGSGGKSPSGAVSFRPTFGCWPFCRPYSCSLTHTGSGEPRPHCAGEKTEAEVEAPVESLGFLPVRDGVLAVSPEPGTGPDSQGRPVNRD